TGLWTVYILVGSHLKDRRLLFYLGDVYRRYQARVPGYPLVPFGPLGKVPLPAEEANPTDRRPLKVAAGAPPPRDPIPHTPLLRPRPAARTAGEFFVDPKEAASTMSGSRQCRLVGGSDARRNPKTAAPDTAGDLRTYCRRLRRRGGARGLLRPGL